MVRKLAKLFRMSRGPWSQSKFGKMLSDAREMLLKGLLNKTIDSSVLEAFLPGVARDVDRPVDSFTVSDLIVLLQKKAGALFSKMGLHCFMSVIATEQACISQPPVALSLCLQDLTMSSQRLTRR